MDSVALATVECRAASAACDTAETCDGTTTACPPDLHASDGTSCDDTMRCNGTASCAAGACVASRLDCNDNDPCTTDACDESSGCTHTMITSCGDAGVDGGEDARADAGADADAASDASADAPLDVADDASRSDVAASEGGDAGTQTAAGGCNCDVPRRASPKRNIAAAAFAFAMLVLSRRRRGHDPQGRP
jgi:MYXO-CTERM domain-containing protein